MQTHENIICILIILIAISFYCNVRSNRKYDKWEVIRKEIRRIHQMAREEETIEGLEKIRTDLNTYCDQYGEQVWRQQVLYCINGKIDSINDQEKKKQKELKDA